MPTKKTRTSAKKSPPKIKAQQQKRTEKLFSEIETLAFQEPAECIEKPRKRIRRAKKKAETPSSLPLSEGTTAQQEREMLHARIQELEAQIQTLGRSISKPDLYERERVGYTFREDRLEPLQISKWDESSEAPNAIRAPLVSTGQTIGLMYLEPTPNNNWESEDETLVQTVAQRASLQIQSLRLLASAERARAEAEAATRQFMHESWKSYLDAIHQDERIGYAYNQSDVVPFLEEPGDTSDYSETVKVMDEQVGLLALKESPKQKLSDEDKKIVASIANQVAQQVENIRLLADASRARAEAEEATRRLTRESWKEFSAKRDSDLLGFIYDSIKVSPLKEPTLPKDIALTVPLEIRGEAIGQIAATGEKQYSAEALDLAKAIATQASIHLETLRLNEELLQRAEELEELDRLKSGFLANMSHELRTPLNSILGFSDVMLLELDGPLTPEMQNDLNLIQKNGQHLLHLINDVLDMAKIESGRMNLKPEWFKVHDLIDEVRSLTSTLASEKNLALFIEEDSDRELEVFADNTRLRQVMINLVNNSIKFTDKGKISIRAKKKNKTTVRITVEDTGIGIPKEKQEDIFQEFTQVDTSSTRKVGGTGLGLPISRRLIEMHGGRLWVESKGISGEGSTFFIEMPIEAKIEEFIEQMEKSDVK